MKVFPRILLVCLFGACSLASLPAQSPPPAPAETLEAAGKKDFPPPWQDLGGGRFEGWSGLEARDGGEAALRVPGTAEFCYPKPEPGGRPNDARYWFDSYGVRFEVRLDGEEPLQLDVTLLLGDGKIERTAHAPVRGAGWHLVSLPWRNFDLSQGEANLLQGVVGLRVTAGRADGGTGVVTLRALRVVRAETVWLYAPERGKPAEAGAAAEYEVLVGNTTDRPQSVALAFERRGWEAMTASVDPATLDLAPDETKTVTVRVNVPARIPPGGHEVQTLRAVGNGVGSPSAVLELVTASRMAHPYLIHTAEGWAQVREKVKQYDWAKTAQREKVAQADRWNVPGVRNPTNPKRGDPLFATQVEHDLMAAGIAYQLTLDNKYGEKVRTFLLRLSDPANGYPVTRRGCDQASVQEGHFFQHVSMAYDMAIPSGVFTTADRAQIDRTLRLSLGERDFGFGMNISNWTVSAECGQLYAALNLQDLAAASRVLYAPGALIDELVQGTLDDGWWYEVSISYNTWVAGEFSQVALAMRPWGLDLAYARFPGTFRPNEQRTPEQTEYGLTDAKWGPITHNWMGIQRMWDVLPAMVDYRGVMFGLNDSQDQHVAGYRGELGASPLELAYYLYRDPAYAAIIKTQGNQRDLLYGVPELPEKTPDLGARSVYADNAGVAALRSRAEGKAPRERIQAVLHYGDHGWYHGHFDIGDLVHVSRYGRGFYHPEMLWYGYPSYLYKFYVQTSLNHNMVVVDGKQQEPTPSRRLLFHQGDLMQACAVETDARWSNPPYGGMVYDEKRTFEEQSFGEGRSVPIPADPPRYGRMNAPTTSLTGYTEPVLQRRLLVVTDDYVVLADYERGEREHTYDSLFQMSGLQGFEAASKKLARHTGQYDPNPTGSGQFITDCDWYDVQAPARGSFRYEFREGKPDTPQKGLLNMDLHALWPARQEVMLATPPEADRVNRQASYAVRGDGRTLAEGKSGMWILGERSLDLPLDGATVLELETQTGVARPGTLFWANARVVTADGRETPLLDLGKLPDGSARLVSEDAAQPKEPGKDFEGGPIKIAGIPYERALSAQPQDGKKPARVRVDLSGLNAVRFRAVLGGDYPVGDESNRRKVFAVRARGKEARFLTLIEPFEDRRMVVRAVAMDADTVRVELADGRVQEIKVSDLQGAEGGNVAVHLTETKDGQATRSESSR